MNQPRCTCPTFSMTADIFSVASSGRRYQIRVTSLSAHCRRCSQRQTGEPLKYSILSLSTHVPAVGETISTYAYPETEMHYVGSSSSINFISNWYHGTASDVFPAGAALLKSPAVAAHMQSLSGCNGGPVYSPLSGGGSSESTQRVLRTIHKQRKAFQDVDKDLAKTQQKECCPHGQAERRTHVRVNDLTTGLPIVFRVVHAELCRRPQFVAL